MIRDYNIVFLSLLFFCLIGNSHAQVKALNLTWSYWNGDAESYDKVIVSVNGSPIGNPEEAKSYLESRKLPSGSVVNLYLDQKDKSSESFPMGLTRSFYTRALGNFLWEWHKSGVKFNYFYNNKKIEKHVIFFSSIPFLEDGSPNLAGATLNLDDKILGITEEVNFKEIEKLNVKQNTIVLVFRPLPWRLPVPIDGKYENWIETLSNQDLVLVENIRFHYVP